MRFRNTRWSQTLGRTNQLCFRALVLVPVLLLVLLLVGCATPQPWVKPYQRDKLADPIMVQDAFPLDTGYMIHLFRSREGGRGAEGAGGGGCGCN